MESCDVVIVGAGAAGLSAARTLARAGRRAIVLEARDRIGGRIHTLHEAGWPLPIEAGAEFIHGEAKPVWAALRGADLKTVAVAEEHVEAIDGRIAPLDFDGFWSTIGERLEHLGENDLSFAEFLRV